MPGFEYGPGTVEERVATLQGLGLDVVRVTVRWDAIEKEQGTFDWDSTDAVLEQLDAAGIDAVVTLYGTPEWANGGKGPNVAPIRGADFAAFAGAAAERYPFVHRWTIWNEPNQRRWLSTASPAQYVTRLLNPAYAAIHAASPSSKVAGGVTAPRGGAGGLSPVAFIRGMGSSGARLDAYAHHPYALGPKETPWSGGCDHCETITMATLDRLVTETRKAFKRPVRLWLTELGYQSNPPDRLLGVAPALQASYIAAAAYKAWATPRVDLLIQYLYRDEPTDRSLAERARLGRAAPRSSRSAGSRRRSRRSSRKGVDDCRVGHDQAWDRREGVPPPAPDVRRLATRRRRSAHARGRDAATQGDGQGRDEAAAARKRRAGQHARRSLAAAGLSPTRRARPRRARTRRRRTGAARAAPAARRRRAARS